MLKGLRVRFVSTRCRSTSRRHTRVVRALPIQKAPTTDPRLRRVFDNVDEKSTRKDRRSVTRENKPTAPRRSDADDDWVEDRERTNADWGVTEEPTDVAGEESSADNFENDGTSYYKASSISALSEADKVTLLGMTEILEVLFTGQGAPSVKLGNPYVTSVTGVLFRKLTWWGAALCGCVLFANSSTWIAALSLSFPLLLPWGMAGLRNWELQSSSGTAFMGIWHCQVLASEMMETPTSPKSNAFSTGQQNQVALQKMARLMIGDPWNGGARTEMLVPLTDRDEVPNVGELCDLLVLTRFNDFREFKAVREAFFPRTRVWLAEYPFINREKFYRLICAIQRQQNEVIMDQDHW